MTADEADWPVRLDPPRRRARPALWRWVFVTIAALDGAGASACLTVGAMTDSAVMVAAGVAFVTSLLAWITVQLMGGAP